MVVRRGVVAGAVGEVEVMYGGSSGGRSGGRRGMSDVFCVYRWLGWRGGRCPLDELSCAGCWM